MQTSCTCIKTLHFVFLCQVYHPSSFVISCFALIQSLSFAQWLVLQMQQWQKLISKQPVITGDVARVAQPGEIRLLIPFQICRPNCVGIKHFETCVCSAACTSTCAKNDLYEKENCMIACGCAWQQQWRHQHCYFELKLGRKTTWATLWMEEKDGRKMKSWDSLQERMCYRTDRSGHALIQTLKSMNLS